MLFEVRGLEFELMQKTFYLLEPFYKEFEFFKVMEDFIDLEIGLLSKWPAGSVGCRMKTG